ncbi:type II protein arginine methyltransferase [Martiniozyma asiatica (nom. inval.)]|nr:type II protein arginine methyltransferase [Martiniozyma asiatica]
MLRSRVFVRGLKHKSLTTRGPQGALQAKDKSSPKAKGLQKLKKETTKTKEAYIHDYSIFPETMQFRLPNEEEKGLPPKEHSNIIKMVFESGGIESMDLDKNQEKFDRFPLTNNFKLNKQTERPGKVKMLSSDFINDSLYNPNYGYFSKEAVIFQPENPFDYNHLQGKDEFMEKWLQAYEKYDNENNRTPVIFNGGKKNAKGIDKAAEADKSTKNNKKDTSSTSTSTSKSTSSSSDFKITKPSLQLWHTPTELFQPFYGEALARHILVNYKLNHYPYNDLIIYEAGAGNGTLMLNILDYLEKNEPDVYARTKYRIIEISSKLFNKQNHRLKNHASKVEIVNQSILDWNIKVEDPCFFIALEVWDNFSHDVIRYDVDTKQPYQGYVVIDEHNDFHEYFSPKLDPWAKNFLQLRTESAVPISSQKRHPLNQFYPIRKGKTILNPLRNNFSDAEFIPTSLLKFFTVLKDYFPNHHLLASDFAYFDKTIPGYNSPTVQTMHKDNMVNVDSYMVEQGYFDIMFPTDFIAMNEMYKQVVGKSSQTCTHRTFLEKWGEIEKTKTKNGENPMLELYENAAFLYS